MMLHRHFESERNKNMTTLADVLPGHGEEDEFDIHAPIRSEDEQPKRGRRKKSESGENN